MMELSERAAGRAKLVGGRLCLDFVNTVGGRRREATAEEGASAVAVLSDKLGDYFDLLAWGVLTGVLTEAEARALVGEGRRREAEAAAVWGRAVALREAIYQLLSAAMRGERPREPDLELINRELVEARGHERLLRAGDGFAWGWAPAPDALDRVLWPVAVSAAALLTGGDLSRLRECGSADCGWLFEDASRNRSRQWCDMKDCGNREKARRFRRRLREEG